MAHTDPWDDFTQPSLRLLAEHCAWHLPLLKLLSRRELWVRRPRREGAQLVALAGRGAVLCGSVEVTLAEDDHSDVGVEVDLAGFGARKPVE